MNTYTQLTQEQRYQIHALLKMKHSRTEIADALGVYNCTRMESNIHTGA